MSEPISDPAETAALEADTDAAIEACGGDPRAAVRALLVANRYLENEVDRLAEAVSAGFTRRASDGRRLRPTNPGMSGATILVTRIIVSEIGRAWLVRMSSGSRNGHKNANNFRASWHCASSQGC
jgi:hypothetical protein